MSIYFDDLNVDSNQIHLWIIKRLKQFIYYLIDDLKKN